MSRHYFSEQNIMGTKNSRQMDLRKETSEWPATPSKYAGFGAAMATELMTGFWFGIVVILATEVVNSLND